MRCDVTDADSVHDLVAAVVENYGRLDIAFNNAGIEGKQMPIAEMSTDEFRRVLDVNLMDVFFCMKFEMPAMLERGGGVIVNPSSTAGLRGYGEPGPYTASKHAVAGLTKSTALEYATEGIRVLSVHPAAIETPMVTRAMEDNPDLAESMESMHPVGRVGQPREIVDVVTFLFSDAASFMTGSQIVVDLDDGPVAEVDPSDLVERILTGVDRAMRRIVDAEANVRCGHTLRAVTDEAAPAPDIDSRVERAEPQAQPLPGWLAIALVAGTSAAVLVLEILAGRLLAPYVGVSLETFTGIIGTILAGIAVGAWAGGVAADRIDPRRLLPLLLVAGGALAIATIPIVRVLGEGGGSGGGMRILVLTAFGFLPSATVLSAIPPAVIKLQLRDLASTGSTVGQLSAWGTGGALFGTFFTGFVLVSAAAVTTLIISVGLLLVAAGLAQWLLTRKGSAGEVFGLGGLAAVSLVGAVTIGSPCETQTTYYCLSVLEDPNVESGRTLILDDLSHSYVDLNDPEVLEFWYVRRIADAIDTRYPAGEVIDVAYIGGGAFTVPRYVRATRPGSNQIIMEIDGDLVEVVEDRFDFDRGDDVEIVVGDGRLAIAALADNVIDVVVGDAFGGRAVPFHLTTREFLVDVDRVLRSDGIYVVNIIDGIGQDFLRAQAATIAAVFDHVLVVRGPNIVEGRSGNSVIIASQSRLDRASLAQRLEADEDPSTPTDVVGEIVVEPELAASLDVEILTDDFAPVDQLLAGGT